MQVSSGPDGYLTTSAAPDFAIQSLLNDVLGELQRDGDQALEKALPRLRRQLSKPQQAGLILAVHRRIAWVAEHDGELADAKLWQRRLALLVRGLYAPTLPFSAEELAFIVDNHRQYRALWSIGFEPLVEAYLETHDLAPELAASLRRFQDDLKVHGAGGRYQSQSALVSAVSQMHVFLWWDEHDAIDRKRCWSEAIRADLRAMAEPRRSHWKALLGHIKGNAPAKPSPSWTKAAEKRLAAVGEDDFKDRFGAWFAPLASGEPQPLSVAGSHILRGLLWYAALTRDPEIAAVALRLIDTTWKAKRNVDKAMVALVGLLATLPPAEAWPALLRLQTEWPTTSVQVVRLFKQVAAELGLSEEELEAQGWLMPRPSEAERLAEIMKTLKGRLAVALINLPPRAR